MSRPNENPAEAFPLRTLLIALALVSIATYAAVALARMRYPFELEWMEGAMLDHVRRILHGLPLYAPPSVDFVALDYTPLFYLISALAARLLGESFLPLRLVSFLASLGSLALIGWMVSRETRSATAGLLAAGLFAAGYRACGAWFDVARPDSLCLFLVLAGMAALRFGSGSAGGPLAAGALLGLACLTKQSALFVAVPLLLHTLFARPRRFGMLAVAFLATVGAVSFALERSSGGWYHFYVWNVALDHVRAWKEIVHAALRDPLERMALASVLGAFVLLVPRPALAPGARGFHGAAAAGLIGGSWLLTTYSGSYDNVFMPAFAGFAILFGLAWHSIAGCCAESPPALRVALARVLTLACAAQFALLAYVPWHQIPLAADRAAGERLLERIRRLPGRVLVPSHCDLAVQAGKPGHFHTMALLDVTTSRRPEGSALRKALRDSLRAGHWRYVVLDDRDLLANEVRPYYESRWAVFTGHERPWTLTGFDIRPDSLAVHRGDKQASSPATTRSPTTTGG
ncbi:MAG TPA: glycosyltransferase family 39 protein [Terriglobales bacterium]|nr:glycosyltransferase family 39 protein [Terriglobales bacterium]